MQTRRSAAATTALAVVLCLTCSALAHAATSRWEPMASGAAVDSIEMVDALRGWAVGPAGLVMATSDGGASWTRQPVPSSEGLAAVAAVDASRVWVGGGGGTILASTDGGATWSDQPTPIGNSLITGIAFPTASHGVAISISGGMIETFDGGATWRGGPGTKNDIYSAIDFFDPQHGIIVGQTSGREGLVLRTSDGGVNWTSMFITDASPSTMYSLDMVSATEAWVGATGGFVFHTTDGGKSWDHKMVGSDSFGGIGMTPGGVGWATTQYIPRLYKTVDGGVTWTLQATPASGHLRAVEVIDASRALVGAGGTSILATTDGTTWANRGLALNWLTEDLRAVDFVDIHRGWVVGDGGTIVGTADGGATWRRQVSGTSQQLRSVDFVDTAQGWAVGGGQPGTEEPPVVLRTIDAGTTWTAVDLGLPGSGMLKVVRFTDASHGFIGTSSGLITTADGGTTWAAHNVLGAVNDLDFPTALVGYAASGASVAKTIDGGATWTEVMPYGAYPGTQSFVDFIDARTGWVNGTYRTTDGGASWTVMSRGPGTDGDISFVDETRGFAAGFVRVLRTIDAGGHWETTASSWTGSTHMPPFPALYIHAFSFVDAAHGWAVGSGGLIVRAPAREPVELTLDTGPTTASSSGVSTALTAIVKRLPERVDNYTGLVYPSPSLPTGNVTFRDRGAAISTLNLDADGRAVLESTFSANVHSFSASYSGDAIYGSEHSGAVIRDFSPAPPAPPPTTTSTTTQPPVTTTTRPAPSPTAPTTTPPTTAFPTTTPSATPRRSGYWMVGRTGDVYAFGDAQWHGNATTPSPVADVEPTASGRGYWVVDSAGQVRPFGDARPMGDSGPLAPAEEVTSLSRTSSGNGYWIFTTHGRVLPRGDAPFFGDMSGRQLNGSVLDSVPAADSRGYYMVASDGGVFAFGTARFRGSMGARRLNAPVQSLVPDVDGVGYWLVAADGGIFAFEAGFFGSMGGSRLNRPVNGMVGSQSGNGYLMVAEDGGIFAFGDARFHGSLGNGPPAAPVVAVAAVP